MRIAVHIGQHTLHRPARPGQAGTAVHIARRAAGAAVEAGIALVPEVMRGYREPRIAYRPIRDVRAGQETTLSLAWVDGNESPAARRFIDLVRTLAAS